MMIIGNEAFIGVTGNGVVITVADPDPALASASIHIEETDIPKVIKFLRSVAPRKTLYGGNFPYGLQAKEGHPHEAEKNHEEVATIDLICHRWRQGDGLRAIARWLNGTGIRNRSGNEWHHFQVRRVLKRHGLIQ
jgi:hypothetical protein